MTLFSATLIVSLLLLLLGGYLCVRGARAGALLKQFPRSQTAAYVTIGLATAWFLFAHILQLGPADFGDYKHIFFVIFLLVGLLSFFYVPDFLAVRGGAALILLGAAAVLSAAFGEPQVSRLFLVTAVYLGIVVAIYLAAVPFRLRDFFEWLFRGSLRSRILGGVLATYGALLAIVAITY